VTDDRSRRSFFLPSLLIVGLLGILWVALGVLPLRNCGWCGGSGGRSWIGGGCLRCAGSGKVTFLVQWRRDCNLPY
jgi:hypothetical protein